MADGYDPNDLFAEPKSAPQKQNYHPDSLFEDWHDVGRAAIAGKDYASDLGGRIAEDIPQEIGKSLSSNLSGAVSGLGYIPKPTDNVTDAIKEGLRVPYETGKGLLHAAATIPDALYSGLNAVVGHPMADAERWAGKAAGASLQHYFPDTAAGELGKRMQATAQAEEADPALQRQHYEQTAQGVPTALAAGRPKGFSPGTNQSAFFPARTEGPVGGRIPGEPRPIPPMQTDQIFDLSERAFHRAHDAGVATTPKSYLDMLENTRRKLATDGGFYNPEGRAKEAYDAIKQITESTHIYDKYGMVGLPQIHGDIKDIRALIRKTKFDTSERAALHMVENELVGFLKDLPKNPSAVTYNLPAGSTRAMQERAITEATNEIERGTRWWAIGRKADAVEEVVKNALGGNKATGTAANVENKIRQGMNSILKSPARRWGYSKEELAAMEKVRDSDSAGEMLRLLSKMAPAGIVSGVGGLEIAHLLGMHGLTMAVPGAIGIAARTAAHSRKLKEAEDISAMMRGQATEGMTTRLPDYMEWKKRRIFDPRVMAPFLSQFNRGQGSEP